MAPNTINGVWSFFMKLGKVVFMVVGSGFLWYQSVNLFLAMQRESTTLGFYESLFVAFLFNLFITGAIALPGFVFSTHKILPDSFYQIENPKLINTVYNVFKVEIFRKLLMIFFWGSRKNRKKYFDGTKRGIVKFIYETKQSEFGHLASLILIQLGSFYFLILGHDWFFVLSTFINIIGNGYPIILQRKHRVRLLRFESVV